MPTYRVHLEYDGTAFHGWQVQPGRRTVQGELHVALARLFDAAIVTTGAGRTDRGVHARGQVASFESGRTFAPERLLRALGALLPSDVRVFGVGLARDGFSARHDARSRHYRYRFWRGADVFRRRTHHRLQYDVDVGAMREAAAVFVGEHDFTAFAASDSAGTGRRCRILDATIAVEGQALHFDVAADHFLHNMVRRMAGTLVEVGRGRSTPAQVERGLESGDPRLCGPCLPPAGLCLREVRYPADAVFEASAVWDAPPGADPPEDGA